MTAYYVETDENGNETKTEKGRGRPRKGYVEVEPGIWKCSDPSAIIQKAEKKNYVYVQFDKDGQEVGDRKAPSRGRPPKGFTRCELMDDGSVEPVGNPVIAIVEDAPADSTEDQADASADDEAECIKPTVSKKSRIVQSDKCSLDDLLKCIKPLSTMRDENIISMVGCDIVGRPTISYLQFNQVLSRIDIDTESGDISVWILKYKPENPDVVIKEAVLV